MTKPITLAELIRYHQETSGESYATIARRANLSKAKIGQLANTEQIHMPRAETIEKLAAGLKVSKRVIQQAAMASAGIAPEGYDAEQRVDYLANQLRALNEEDLDFVTVVIDSLKNRRALRHAST